MIAFCIYQSEKECIMLSNPSTTFKHRHDGPNNSTDLPLYKYF